MMRSIVLLGLSIMWMGGSNLYGTACNLNVPGLGCPPNACCFFGSCQSPCPMSEEELKSSHQKIPDSSHHKNQKR